MPEPARQRPGRAPAAQPARPLRIEVFGFDVAEISQIRRIRAMRAAGYAVHSFTMRRQNMNRDFRPDWPNTHLFNTVNDNLPLRAAAVAGSVAKVAPHGARLRQADMIVARNLDMLAIAWAARASAGAGRVPLVYECLDINGALVGEGAKARAMRRAERFLLARCAMLVVSSPSFVTEYFAPLQAYDGPWALWENKLAAGAALPARPHRRAAPSGPLRLGWVGTIRCAPSLALLAALADRMGPAIRVEIHGVVHRHALPEFDAVLAARPNMTFHGPYAYPDDLARVYGGCDLVWAQDLWQRGSNSDWLLPNRIYEASWAGCPSIAVAGTETGRRVEADGLGWAIARPEADDLAALLAGLTPEAVAARGAALLARPETDFVQSPEDITAVVERVCSGGAGT
ncbi:glycosyltransferase [Roseivivax isoporae]|uniref:Succinoglycan biosynthesis protein n=1 Tax=Roseivivax isoporae LMG 25204 TaxID=1449351 RepID=X7F576_9RHOB|nr:glycosyltransferase [Roseivivax isoporae]ETX27224.1 succinoglycan biosynthesis protein [Roseivivax isoporae LMG 25204]